MDVSDRLSVMEPYVARDVKPTTPFAYMAIARNPMIKSILKGKLDNVQPLTSGFMNILLI